MGSIALTGLITVQKEKIQRTFQQIGHTKIIQKNNEAIKNIQDKITKPNGRIEIEAQTLENVKIKMIFDIEKIGEQNICTMISCYPVLDKSKS